MVVDFEHLHFVISTRPQLTVSIFSVALLFPISPVVSAIPGKIGQPLHAGEVVAFLSFSRRVHTLHLPRPRRRIVVHHRRVLYPPHVPAKRRLFPTMQRVRDRYAVDLDVAPFPFGQHRVRDARRRENGRDVPEALPERVAHFVNVVPLLFRDGGAHVVDVHLGLVEEPLEYEQRRWKVNRALSTLPTKSGQLPLSVG